MTSLDIAHRRLHNQRIAGAPLAKPEDVVQWLGAVQAQDYAGAKWAVGQRAGNGTDAAIDRAFADGAILRTHVMRPTWHFIAPNDIRWMLALTAPRVNALNAYRYRRLELDDAVFARSNAAISRALRGGKELTRLELVCVLEQAGIHADDPSRFGHLIMRAELDAVVCSGALRGNRHTYALLEERAPRATTLERDEALAELAGRYFTSHGPATLKDYVWWSGLTVTDAKRGLEMVRPHLIDEVVDGRTHWFSASTPPARDTSPTAYLLPNFDEYIVGYTDRGAAFDAAHAEMLGPRGNVLFSNIIVIDGRVAGTWKRTFRKSAVAVEMIPFARLNDAEIDALTAAAKRYGAFVDLPVDLQLPS